MFYERSLEIEHRLETVLNLIRTGNYSTPLLAEKLHVSIPTISRIVAALRKRGHDVRAERLSDGWRYVLTRTNTSKRRNRAVTRPLPPSSIAAG